MSPESRSQIAQRRQELEQQFQQFHDGLPPLRPEEASETERRRSRSKRRSPDEADPPGSAPHAAVQGPHIPQQQQGAERLADLEKRESSLAAEQSNLPARA